MSSKKRRGNDIPPCERMDAANFDKVRNQVPRTQDIMAQRSEESKRILGLNEICGGKVEWVPLQVQVWLHYPGMNWRLFPLQGDGSVLAEQRLANSSQRKQ